MGDVKCHLLFSLFSLLTATYAVEVGKEQVDNVIEAELTQKLSNDLLQSIERKFQVDLEKSVDMVLLKIKLLLQNGTLHIQERLSDLQGELDTMKNSSGNEVEKCLSDQQNRTASLAEKALHQMVVCGYALIGHDPAQAVKQVMALKNMINADMKPVHEQKAEVYSLLKICGHEHDTLKKVIKCVISKSPIIKATMMDITGKLIDGVVTLTKLMAHGAMHEACLIEVIKTTEDEAFQIVKGVKRCVNGNHTNTEDEINNYILDNNATVLDVDGGKDSDEASKDVKHIIRKMLAEKKTKTMSDKELNEKFLKLQEGLRTDQNDVLK